MTTRLETFSLAALALVFSGLARAGGISTLTDMGFVLLPPSDGPFAGGVGAPTVTFDQAAGLYHLYFESGVPADSVPERCDTYYVIGHATSPDGLTWTYDSDPVLVPAVDTWYGCGVAHPAVLFDGRSWHLWFTASEEPAKSGAINHQTGIGHATSSDGVDWTVDPDILLPEPVVTDENGDEVEPGMGFPTATMVDGRIYLLYVVVPEFHLATSDDLGATWQLRDQAVLSPGAYGSWMEERIFGPSLLCERDPQRAPFSLFFGGKDAQMESAFGMAVSSDAIQWFIDSSSPIFSEEQGGMWNHWDVLGAGTEYLLYYSTDDADGLKAIGLAATATDWPTPSSRVCTSNPDTGTPDTGTPDTGTPDTGPALDTGPTADTAGLTEGTSQVKGGGGCGCASGPGAGGAAGLLLAGLLAVARRRSP